MCRNPVHAKGLLLASIRCPDPVIFFEPKALYRAAVGEVPTGDFEMELGKAEIVTPGSDVTVVGWGSQVHVLHHACEIARKKLGVKCELIDLCSLLPWDKETVVESVKKTGRLVISHEAPVTGGLAGEISATVQESCFLSLESPIARVCGYDTPFPLTFEREYVPDALKVYEAIKGCVRY